MLYEFINCNLKSHKLYKEFKIYQAVKQKLTRRGTWIHLYYQQEANPRNTQYQTRWSESSPSRERLIIIALLFADKFVFFMHEILEPAIKSLPLSLFLSGFSGLHLSYRAIHAWLNLISLQFAYIRDAQQAKRHGSYTHRLFIQSKCRFVVELFVSSYITGSFFFISEDAITWYV